MPRILPCVSVPALLLAVVFMAGCSGAQTRRRRAPQPVPPLAKAVLRTARSYLPEEERHRRTPKDCSDFVRSVFSEHGIGLPRTSQEMSLRGERVYSSRDLRMGDLVFFSGEKVSRIVGHVGIYVNNGIFIHFPNTGQVVMESMHSDYYRRRYLTGRRVIAGAGG
ncbi:MAG: C40 family peptidase [Elusimicrobiota bacterium]|jgi:cell wall-associated NlpC family hydrolase